MKIEEPSSDQNGETLWASIEIAANLLHLAQQQKDPEQLRVYLDRAAKVLTTIAAQHQNA